MVSIPSETGRETGTSPGDRLDWQLSKGTTDMIRAKVTPDRAELARRLLGRGKILSPGRGTVAELTAEREAEG